VTEQAPITLASPVRDLLGIGPRRALALLELGVKSVGQLVAYLPVRHEKLEAEGTIDALVMGTNAAVRGEVTATRVVARKRPQRFEAVLVDGTGRLDLTWFNGGYLHGTITPGVRLRVQGKPQRYGPGVQMVNPKHEVLRDEGTEPALRSERLRPVYPASATITSKQIEEAIAAALPSVLPLIHDHLPPEYCVRRELVGLGDAYRLLHQPRSPEDIAAARRRLAFDELLMLQLALALKRAHVRAQCRAVPLRATPAVDKHIRQRFPFALTPAQDRVVRELAGDLARPEPASRLVQGDVGSGKTIVALYAMLLAVATRSQAALMAPTELLAEQHFASISRVLAGSDVRTALLTGSLNAARRAGVLAGLADGSIDLVVGTHAILTGDVAFQQLAVAVIDEQHRFGVHQRLALRAKGAGAVTHAPDRRPLVPHTLVMTATPIPRTLAMTVLGDLDVSTIDQLPPGRKPVATRVVDPMLRQEVYAMARQRITLGERVYIVAPAIDRKSGEADDQDQLWQAPSKPGSASAVAASLGTIVAAGHAEASAGGRTGRATPPPQEWVGGGPAIHTSPGASCAAAPAGAASPGPLEPVPMMNVADLLAELRAGPLAGLRLEALHGRIPGPARDEIMARFRAGEIDALVATTVIEVGVDVPDATVMIVENADRFGLATLHQLRGRVGRGTKGGVCVLIASPPTSSLASGAGLDAGERLAVMAQTSDGFVLAQRDVEIRGFGDVIGVRQSGMPPFRVADLTRDMDLLTLARRDATSWLDQSPTLSRPDELLLRNRLMKVHGKWLGLADVG
jgi:ATP-dependent DNA helicase RecG